MGARRHFGWAEVAVTLGVIAWMALAFWLGRLTIFVGAWALALVVLVLTLADERRVRLTFLLRGPTSRLSSRRSPSRT